jgi:hypothetical protein
MPRLAASGDPLAEGGFSSTKFAQLLALVDKDVDSKGAAGGHPVDGSGGASQRFLGARARAPIRY